MGDKNLITQEEGKVLMERWLRGDDTLTLQERVYVLEKMVKRLFFLWKNTKVRNGG